MDDFVPGSTCPFHETVNVPNFNKPETPVYGCAEPEDMCSRCRSRRTKNDHGWYNCCGVSWQPLSEDEIREFMKRIEP